MVLIKSEVEEMYIGNCSSKDNSRYHKYLGAAADSSIELKASELINPGKLQLFIKVNTKYYCQHLSELLVKIIISLSPTMPL